MNFSELQENQKFKFKDNEYVKTSPVKVSCCKTLNAIQLSTNTKVMFRPKDKVELIPDNE
jgi:hypothetical protein